MSILSAEQWRTISAAASFGMMPSLACARASAASKSRYFCTRFSSENTSRIGSVVKMSRNTAESRIVEGIRISCGAHVSVSRTAINTRSEQVRQLLLRAFRSQMAQNCPRWEARDDCHDKAAAELPARARTSEAGRGAHHALCSGG